MKENKYLGLSIAVSIAAVLWAIFATAICVKQDRDNQKLIGMVTHCQERCKQLLEEKRQDICARITAGRHELVIVLADTAYCK